MTVLLDVSLKEFRQQKEEEEKRWEEWEREMKRAGYLKKCKCGNAYTWAHLGHDPGKCPACRGDEGDLIY